MYLSATCPKCKRSYRIGELTALPQPSRLTRMLGDIVHEHSCEKVLDFQRVSA